MMGRSCPGPARPRLEEKGHAVMTDGNAEQATFRTPEGKEVGLKVHRATEGAAAADVGSLLSGTGYVTYDLGFANTAFCTSEIPYIDGDAGTLRSRGYPIDELASSSSSLEVSHLLIHGELPTSDELAD